MEELLARIAENLPSTEDINELEDILELREAWDGEVEGGRTLLSLDDGTSENLPPKMKDLWQMLVYVDSVIHLLDVLTWDGLFSVFYNETGEEIELLRKGLNSGEGTLASLFEEACALVLPKADIVATSNFVTRNPGADPMTQFDDVIIGRLDEIDDEMEDIRHESYERAIAMYKAGRLISWSVSE